MDVVFKAINNKAYPYNVNPDDCISTIIDKLSVDANVNKDTHNFKIIFQGKVLSMEQKFSEFTSPNPKDKLTFVFMTTKTKTPTSNIQTSQSKSVPATNTAPALTSTPAAPVTVHTQSVPYDTNDTNQNSYDDGFENPYDNIDETDKLRSALIGLLVFIRAQPQMMELFNNNFEAFAQIIMSPQFKPMFEAMCNDMSAGEEQLDNLTDSVLSHSAPTNSPAQTVTLNQEDMSNIATLEALGFSKQACVQAYMLANKNLDMAASMLMDM